MAERLREIMNTEVLRFEVDAPASSTLELMLTMGVTAAPVVDERDHPIGVVSVRDLARTLPGTKVRARMHAPAVIASPELPLLDAARLLDEANLHHLVVTDPDGATAGFVSSLDLLRGIVGAPARHPDTFVHWDRAAGTAFSNDRKLDPEHIGDVPHTAGLIVITRGGAGRPERVAWAETTLDLKRWLFEYFAGGDANLPDALAAGHRDLRYRYAEISDWRTREEAAFAVREQAQLEIDRDPRAA